MKNFNLIEWLWKTDSHEKQSPQRLVRYAAMLIMLLTIGVGQMWAEPWVKLDVSTGKQGTKTVGDKLNGGSEWWFNYQTNGGWGSESDIQVLIGTSSSSYSTVNASWYADDGGNKKVHADIGSFTFDKSGKWYAVGKYTNSGTAYTSGTSWTSNTSLSTSMSTSNSPYWEVTPPSVKSFAVSTTGSDILSGTGTSADPYIISYNGSLVLSLSGSKNKTDANSSLQYNTAGTWNSTTSRTISSITSTTKTSVTVKMRCYNSTASLSGTESSKQIYYKSEASYNVTAASGGNGSVTPTSATAMGTTSGGNITATPNTGYNFTSWAITSGSGYFGSTGTATTSTTANTKFRPAEASTVTATFTAKTYTITLNKNGADCLSNGSATATYNSGSVTSATYPTYTDYRCDGYFTAADGGTKVLNTNGTFVASVTNYTDGSGNWTRDANTTLYAHWTYDVTNYTVNFGAGTSYTSLGSVTAYNNNTFASISTGASVRSGHSVTFTASPNTGYVVEGWYTDAACTNDKHDAGETTYTESITGTTNVYVKFVEKTWSVAFAAGTGGSVTTPAATPQTVGQVTGISIEATPGTGYTFNTWTITSGSGSFTSAATTNSNTFKPTAASTVTASFTETMRTITINGGTEASTTAGISTTGSATAAAPAAGKKFTGWSLGAGVTLSGGALTDRTINFTATGNSSVTANYADRAQVKMYFAKPTTLSWGTLYAYAWQNSNTSNKNATYPGIEISTTETINHVVYYVYQYYTEGDGIGGSATGQSTWDRVIFGCNTDSKKTGDLTISNGHYYFKSSTGTGKTAALTSAWCIKGAWNSWSEDADQITHSAAATGSKTITLTTGNKEFKIYNIVNETWWRFSGNVTATKAATTMANNIDGNMTLTPTIAGNYTFALASLTGTPTLAITYPTAYQLNYSIGTVAGTSGSISSDPTTATGSYVASGNTVTLTAPSEKTGYSWKGWYGAAAGTGDQLCATKAYAITMNSAKTVYACYTENQYNVAVSAGAGGSVSPTGTVAVKQVNGTSLTATPSEGYSFTNWTISGGGITPTTSSTSPQTFKATTTGGTIQANFSEIMRTVTVAVNNSYLGSVSTTSLSSVGPVTKSAEVTATPVAGATFSNWSVVSGLTIASGYTSSSNPVKVNATAASKTLTANFTETMHTVTLTTADASKGTVGSSPSVGQITAVQITATPKSGYMFSKWVKTAGSGTVTYYTGAGNGQVTDASGDEKETTYICVTGNVTLQATWEPDRSSGYVVHYGNSGKNADGGDDASQTRPWKDGKLYRATTEASDVSYFTFTAGVGDVDKVIYFKIWDLGSNWYGYNSASGGKFSSDITNVTLNTSYGDARMCIIMPGTYTFTWNKSTKKLSVAYPTDVYYVRGGFNSWAWSHPMTETSSGVYSATVNMTEANHTYEAGSGNGFKVLIAGKYYGKNSTTVTRSTSTGSAAISGCSTSGANIGITTDYTGDYTFTYTVSTNTLQVTYPTAYKITFGKGAVDGTTGSFSAVNLSNGNSAVTSNSTWVKSGHNVKITAPSAKTGYRLLGWYDNNSATGVAITTLANCTITVNTDKTVYACYAPKQSALTFDYQTSATGYGSSGSISAVSATYGAAMPSLSGSMPTAANGYAFMGFYDATGGDGTKYYNADGSSAHNWDKDVTTGTTLYAYYKKAEITELTFDAASVEAGGEVGVTPTIAPTPEPTVSVCWRVLYNNDNPLDPQPEISWDDTKATFTAPLASGTYKVEAKLRTGSSCGGGTLLDTRVASFTVAGTHTVTINYKCGDDVIKASTTTTGRPFDWSGDITAPDIFGYTFSSWTAGDGITIKDGESSTATTHIKATYNGTLTANYTQKSLIYFKNTLGWEDVYVNFYTDAKWNNPKGSGNQGVTNRNKHMTRIGDSDVWYYDYGYNEGGSSISPTLYVSFTSVSQDNSEYFWYNPVVNVVYPANYPDAINTNKSSENGFKAATPMFVPLATQDGVTLNSSGSGKADYYNAGYWTKYTPGTGYRLEIYNSAGNEFIKAAEFTSGDDLMPMTAVVDLDGGQTYKFQLRRGGESSAGIYYGNSGTMTYANHGQNGAWDMTNGSFSMCGITTTASGNYTFHLSYGGHPLAEAQYRLRMAVDYPVATGDYRVIYKDNVHTGFKPSAIVQKVNNSKDTVSFFIRPEQTPVMKIQQATVNGSTGAITWSAGTDVSSSLSALSKDSVYNICLTMDENGAISVENVAVYTGNFYIRTDAANSKWDNYRSDPDHRMTYSEYSITHGGYSHYYCHWVQADDSRKNVKFVIANDYSPCISDTLTRETASGTWANIEHHIDEYGNILRNANVRFMWNQHDNTVSRAYVDGAQGTGSNIFLYILSEDGKIKKSSGSALDNNKVQFSDNGNWIYEANIQAQPDAAIKLLSNWSDSYTITQYFKGGVSSTETLIGGSGSTWYNIRVIYDYKTNRLVSAWIPSGEIGAETNINADVMFIREHQGDIAQLTFTGDGAIKKIETAYGVLRFNKWTLNNKDKSTHTPLAEELSRYERDLFYVSFPFRVSMEEVFGFGTYGTHWIIEYYDGAGRAANGYWLESGPNWKFITNRKGKFFEPYEGYIIALDLDELGESSDVWANTDQVELYFPSYGSMPNITNASYTHEIPAHLCTINRSDEPKSGGGTLGAEYDRRVKDSHWNVLSVPTYVNINNVSFANTDWITTADDTHVGPNFLYEWNPADNTVTARSGVGYNYHAMHAYLVQYCGDVTWTSSVSVKPSSIVAREQTAPKNVEFKVELMQNEKAVDQTFVKLSDNENVTTGFEFNYDMSKEFNKNKANIYTMITSNIDGDLSITEAAGNVLPMSEQTTVVPVGVKIVANGDYTFSIPDGTEGTGVTLIDNETGVHTNLALMDYTVALEAGTYDGRFILEISPIAQTPTGVDTISDEGLEMKGARKVIIDEKMYILKDGKVYDARGARVQ